jgi:hypothetical protein
VHAGGNADSSNGLVLSGSRPAKAAPYSIKPLICFLRERPVGSCLRVKHPMTKSDVQGEKEGLMTRKLLMTVAIVAIALAPSIGTGTAQARGFGGGFGGGGFHGGGFGGRGFYGGYGRGFYGGYGGFYPGYYGYGNSPYCYYCY